MISHYLTDKLDGLTTKLQQRGYRLTDINVWVIGTCFVVTVMGSISRESYVFAVINGLIWGHGLWERMRWAEKNKDYPESLSIMDRLNMEAMFWRERFRWFTSLCCYVGLFFLSANATALIIEGGGLAFFMGILEWIAIPAAFLIRGCFFIGPGEFAKQKQDRELHNAVLDKLP